MVWNQAYTIFWLALTRLRIIMKFSDSYMSPPHAQKLSYTSLVIQMMKKMAPTMATRPNKMRSATVRN